MIEFVKFPSVARLNRAITITEKIDGTNGAIGIVAAKDIHEFAPTYVSTLTGEYHVYAQSRTRIITPKDDNHGFARWVWENAEQLINVLGPGLHFGEWWGSGIQRGYGLPKGEKRFSLFNTRRWELLEQHSIPELCVVPVLYEGPFDNNRISRPWEWALNGLQGDGSHAAPGFMRPEGVVIYHHHANMCFKVTLENDEVPKSVAERDCT